MSWISDSRGFSYTIFVERTKVTAKTNTNVDQYILEVHFKALESYRNYLLRSLVPRTELDRFAKLLSAGRLKRLLVRLYWRIKLLSRKCYNLVLRREKLGGERMPAPEKKDLFEELLKTPDWLTQGKTIQWSEEIKNALIDLTRLTITTTGAGGKKIETIIKLTGDVESTNELLSDDQLVAYHERMSKLSIEIMKTYAQILIQIVSVFVPWAGLKVPTDLFKNFADLVKAINLPATQPTTPPPTTQ